MGVKISNRPIGGLIYCLLSRENLELKMCKIVFFSHFYQHKILMCLKYKLCFPLIFESHLTFCIGKSNKGCIKIIQY